MPPGSFRYAGLDERPNRPGPPLTQGPPLPLQFSRRPIRLYASDRSEAKGHSGEARVHRAHRVGYVFKGVYLGGESADEQLIEVKRGNYHVRRGEFIGETVAFDLEATRFVTRDTSGDGERSLDDLQKGDWVLVKAMLPRRDPGEQPFTAKRLIDKTSFRK